jgi:hypothetical protein
LLWVSGLEIFLLHLSCVMGEGEDVYG